jgi:hypothetical protein
VIHRPRSVTVIAWWLILSGLLGAYNSATLEMNPLAVQMAAQSAIPLHAQQLFGVINGAVVAASGIAFLKGIWWSRLAYLIWSLVSILISIFTVPLWLVAVLLVFYVIILSALCRRSVNLWFESCSI